MNTKLALLVGSSMLLAACGLRGFPEPLPTVTAASSTQTETAMLPPIVLTPAAISTPTLISTIPATVLQGPDSVQVPILLYHRIDVSLTDSQYYVSPEKFDEQMDLLQEWDYTSITTELLVKAIRDGAELPLNPILITFDDGNLDNYTTAFPIMQKYGFTGVLYIVGAYMGTPGYLDADQIKEMARAGWEVGSHTMRHLDLSTLDPEQQQYEIAGSRRFLESELDLPILTFSYPFGVNDIPILNYTYSAGYIAGMGIGYSNDQRKSYLFALQRRAVNGTADLAAFAALLPWKGEARYLPSVLSEGFRPGPPLHKGRN